MSKEVASDLRKVRAMLSVPGGRCINNGWGPNLNGGTARCLGAAIGHVVHKHYGWNAPAFEAVADVIRARVVNGGFLPEPKFGAGGGDPSPWDEVITLGDSTTALITQFNNSTTDDRVLELLDEVIAKLDPPKVPKPEGEPETMKVRELEYA